MIASQQRYCQLRRDVGLLGAELEGASGDQAELLSERLAETETEAELALVGPPNPEVEELAALWEELGRRYASGEGDVREMSPHARAFMAELGGARRTPPSRWLEAQSVGSRRVQNGVRQLGHGGHARPLNVSEIRPICSENVPARVPEWTRVPHLSFPANEGVPGSSPGVSFLSVMSARASVGARSAQ